MRRIAVVAAALLISVQIVRTAGVRAFVELDPASAARFWRGHPAVELSGGMVAIASATHLRRPVSPKTLRSIYDAAAKDPLAAQPFLVRGVEAGTAGNARLASQAFEAAEWRNPRSLPARYFLADNAFRNGDAPMGMREIAALARLAPGGVTSLAPFLAGFALDRSNWPQLRSLFRSQPELAAATFSALALDPAHADVILALADKRQLDPKSPWVPVLLGNLVNVGEYAKARQLWATVSHDRADPQLLLFDAQFTRDDAPPPFNWSLTSSTVGLAERQPRGGLHVIYYGQEDGVLATQLLMLAPGAYRLDMSAAGDVAGAGALQWHLVCASSSQVIASEPLTAVAQRGWAITVPANCKAQRLELVGTSTDMPQQVDVIVRELRLKREGRGA